MASNKRPSDEVYDSSLPKRSHSRPYRIQKVKETRIVKYGAEEFTFKASFKPDHEPARLLDAQGDLHDIFDDIIAEATNHYDQNDRVSLSYSIIENNGNFITKMY